MLKPIDRALPPQHQFSPLEPVAQKTLHFGDSITTVKKQTVDVKKRALELLNRVWDWVRVYFLFFCMDDKKGIQGRDHKQLQTYIGMFLQGMKTNPDEEKANMVKEYQNLSGPIRVAIEKEMRKIVEGLEPNKSNAHYDEQMAYFLKEPFASQMNENKKPITVFYSALLKTQETLAGF